MENRIKPKYSSDPCKHDFHAVNSCIDSITCTTDREHKERSYQLQMELGCSIMAATLHCHQVDSAEKQNTHQVSGLVQLTPRPQSPLLGSCWWVKLIHLHPRNSIKGIKV